MNEFVTVDSDSASDIFLNLVLKALLQKKECIYFLENCNRHD